MRFNKAASAVARVDGGRCSQAQHPALDTPSTRAIAAIGKQAWFALMNRKSRTAACRSPEQTRPRLLKEYRAPAAAACSHAAAGSTHHARMRSDQQPPPPGGPRFGQPGRPTREWSGRLAQTRGQDRQDYVQHGPGRPSVGETPANTVDVFLASAAPLARDSGCPPNRVNPSHSACCVLYLRFTLSYRDVEELLAERGLDISYETV